jgi:phosphohistidine phosphatase
MNIYLIRHGKAEPGGISKKDFDRNLTADGIEILKTACAEWKRFIDGFDYIVSSPLNRAKQTAEIIEREFKPKNKLLLDKTLSPGSCAEDIIEIANSLKAEDIAFVGHQPDFSEIVSEFISYSGALVDFKKGMIAKVIFHGKAARTKGMLEFLIPTAAFKKK